jgi:hypothetical protein
MSDTAQRKELCHGSVGSSLTFEKRAMAGSKLSLQTAHPAAIAEIPKFYAAGRLTSTGVSRRLPQSRTLVEITLLSLANA